MAQPSSSLAHLSTNLASFQYGESCKVQVLNYVTDYRSREIAAFCSKILEKRANETDSINEVHSPIFLSQKEISELKALIEEPLMEKVLLLPCAHRIQTCIARQMTQKVTLST